MPRFTSLVKVNEETLYFSFLRIYTAKGQKFFVSVCKDRRYSGFDMIKDEEGDWRIDEPAPAWAREIENQLSKTIDKNS